MKHKWYLSTWLICLLFAFWFFIIPAVIGLILLIMKYKEDKKDKLSFEELEMNYRAAQNLMTPEMRTAHNLEQKIQELTAQETTLQNNLTNLNAEIQQTTQHKEKTITSLDSQIQKKKQNLIQLDDEILMQDFGLYRPVYNFMAADNYKSRLNDIRQQQKNMIKTKTAVSGNTGWTVNGSAAQGRKMVQDMQKLLLRAFNSECDTLVSNIKYNNFDSYLTRMEKSKDAISKLGKIMGVAITPSYFQLKVQEMHLALEYQIKKQEEKEAAKEARAEMREAAKLQKELAAERKKTEKEQTHYKNALTTVLKQIEASGSPSTELLEKKAELEGRLNIIEASLKDLDYREANQRAGYVYVISNIGSFGPNIYKIGMTRRLDPQERVDELGDASVPFNFDVHAMIFSDDAPALEAALHRAFDNRKLNMINKRREFFNVTLDEIKEEVRKNFDKTVEFIEVPEATQYRESQKMKEEL